MSLLAIAMSFSSVVATVPVSTFLSLVTSFDYISERALQRRGDEAKVGREGAVGRHVVGFFFLVNCWFFVRIAGM